VSRRHAFPQLRCAERDRRAAIWNTGDWSTDRAGAPADAGRGLDQVMTTNTPVLAVDSVESLLGWIER
jgi:hypothetical protein